MSKIIKKMVQVSLSTFLSRCLGMIREVLLLRFLGIGMISDAFYAAFNFPNNLRKVLAEGTLSSVLIPSFIRIEAKEGKAGVNKLITLSLIIIEFFILLLTLFFIFKANTIIKFFYPGFAQIQIESSAKFLKILSSFILFISSGSIFSAALQSENHFFIPALSPSILNIIYVSGLFICIFYKLSPNILCAFMIAASVVFLIINFIAFLKFNFSLKLPDKNSWYEFKTMFFKFIPYFISFSIVEINFFIDTYFASYLPTGSFSLVRFAYRFIYFPLGIIGAAVATVLLPHFSRTALKNPENLGAQLLEAIKLVLWATIPVSLVMSFFSNEIFGTFLYGSITSPEKINLVKNIFIAYMLGLLFFSLNKVILNIFYALRLTSAPLVITCIAAIVNFFLDKFLVTYFGGIGLALATTISACIQTLLFLTFLALKFKFDFKIKEFLNFLRNSIIQWCIIFFVFYNIYYLILNAVNKLNLKLNCYFFILNNKFLMSYLGIWFFIIPISLALFFSIFKTRKFFKIKIFYLDE